MKSKIYSVSSAALILLAAITLLATSAAAKPAKKDGEKGSYIKPAITAEQAIASVKAALPGLTVGKSIIKTGPRGEKKLEVLLVLDGKIVSRVKLNPSTGEIMTKGQDVMAQEVLASQGQAAKIVQEAIPKLEVASVRLGKQGEWIVDLTLHKAVVASLGVHGGNGSILPDWKASRDATLY
uniref:PepSY domain-containing protein n=1 Tax=Anaerolinea thermolimosa TaxID=229919 RepID=A0A7C4PNP2_9CHLR